MTTQVLNIRVDLGPHPRAIYSGSQVIELTPYELDDSGFLTDALADIADMVQPLDAGIDPFGPFDEQISKVVHDLNNRAKAGEKKLPRKILVLATTAQGAKDDGDDAADESENINFDVFIIPEWVDAEGE